MISGCYGLAHIYSHEASTVYCAQTDMYALCFTWLDQVGSLVAFFDPAPKLKTRRLTGVVQKLTRGGTQAIVTVTDSKQSLTINSSLLSHRGNLDEVS